MDIETRQGLIVGEKEKVANYSHPHVGVMLTYLCGGKCVGCIAGMDRPNKIRDRTFMSGSTVNLIIDQLKGIPGVYMAKLTITGGEPSLHPDFIGICERFADAGFNVRISTNANFISLGKPFEEQPKLVGLLNLIGRKNVSVKLPLDEMHADSFPRLPEIMKRLNPYLRENGFVYGQDYVYATITNSLEGIARGAIRYGYTIDHTNAIGLIRDWRPYYQDLTQLSKVVNFLQVGPEGLVFQNYFQVLARNPLGFVDNLGKFVRQMAQKMEQGSGSMLKHTDIDADWTRQAEDLVRIYADIAKNAN